MAVVGLGWFGAYGQTSWTDNFNSSTLNAAWATSTGYSLLLYKNPAQQVSGAGCAFVNGVYHQQGVDGVTVGTNPRVEKPRYLSADGQYAIGWRLNSNPQWQIYKVGSSFWYYWSTSDTATPNLAANWQLKAPNGVNPLPTVTVQTPTEESMLVDCNKGNTGGAQWDAFTYNPAGTINISTRPYITMKIRTDKDFNMYIVLWDTDDTSANGEVVQEVRASSTFQTYSLDYAAKSKTLGAIDYLIFTPNPATGCDAQVWIDDFNVGTTATASPNMSKIDDQPIYINSSLVLPIRGILGRGTITVTATSTNTTILPHPTVSYTSPNAVGTLTMTPSANQYGNVPVNVTVHSNDAGQATDLVRSFTAQIERNAAPTLDNIANQVATWGIPISVPLAGIDDGNGGANQTITVTATSGDTTIIPSGNIVVNYTAGSLYKMTGSLTITPAASGTPGTVVITTTATDNGGTAGSGTNAVVKTFNVAVYNSLNNAPTLDDLNDMSFKSTTTTTVQMTGISSGDPGSGQSLNITATSSDTTQVQVQSVNYTGGMSTGTIVLKSIVDAASTVTITVTVTDNGAAAGNNGNASTIKTFVVTVVAPTYGWADDFADGVMDPNWDGITPGGSPTTENCHTLNENSGFLKINLNKQTGQNCWGGQWYMIPRELNMLQNPYISNKGYQYARVQGWTNPFLERIYLWDYQGDYNTITSIGRGDNTLNAGTNTQMYFNFSAGLNTAVNLDRIVALLINFDPGGGCLGGTRAIGEIWWDDLMVGDAALRVAGTTLVGYDNLPDWGLVQNPGAQSWTITSIADGKGGIQTVGFAATSNNATLVPNPTITPNPVPAGQTTATLSFTPGTGTGQATITVTGTSTGSTQKQVTFVIRIVAATPITVDTTVTRTTTYQTMGGLGAFIQDTATLSTDEFNLVKDIGLSANGLSRGMKEIEPINENGNCDVLDLSKYDFSGFSWKLHRDLKAKSGIEKWQFREWSPPNYMKQNKSHGAEYNGPTGLDNVLDTYVVNGKWYNCWELGEAFAAYALAWRNNTGFPLYGMNLQNEPQFNEFYDSCRMTSTEERDYFKNGFGAGIRAYIPESETKITWGAVLEAQGQILTYYDDVMNDTSSRQYANEYQHQYILTDGLATTLLARANAASPPRTVWTSECSYGGGTAGQWSGGGLNLAMDLVRHFTNGAHGWLAWGYSGSADAAQQEFIIVADGKHTNKSQAIKHIAKYIRPGAVRVQCAEGDTDVYSMAWRDDAKGTHVVVLVNYNATTAKTFRVQGTGIGTTFDKYLSVDNGYHQKSAYTAGATGVLPANSVTTLISYSILDITTDTPLPDGGQGTAYSKALTAVGNTGAVTWTWSAVSGYILPPGLALNSTSGLISGTPTAGDTYKFVAQASDTKPSTDTKEFTLTIVAKPLTPTALSAIATSTTVVSLNWTDNAYNETSYRVERSTTSSSSGFVTIASLAASSYSYSNTGCTSGTTYYYRVYAVSTVSGDSLPSNVASATPRTTGTPVAPTALQVLAGTDPTTQINLSWTDNANNEMGFQVERSLDGTSNFVLVNSTAANIVACTDSGLLNCTTYYYRVRAYNTGVYSTYITGNRTTTGCTSINPPGSFTAAAAGPSQINLTWTDTNTNETGYAIERGTDGATYAPLASLPAGTVAYTDGSLNADTTYYYRAKATGSPSDSTWVLDDAKTLPPYVILVTASTTQLTLGFNTVSGKTYRLMSNTTTPKLSDAGWTFTGSSVTGTGSPMNFVVTKPASGKIFYTVEFTQ